MTQNKLFAEIELEATEQRELEGININDFPGQDDEVGEREVLEEQTD